MAGKRNRKSSRSPTAASVANRKNRKCWRTSWRTLRIYLSGHVDQRRDSLPAVPSNARRSATDETLERQLAGTAALLEPRGERN